MKSWSTVQFRVFDAEGNIQTFIFQRPGKGRRYTQDGLFNAAGSFMAWLQKNCPGAQFRLVPIKGNKFNVVPEGTPVRDN